MTDLRDLTALTRWWWPWRLTLLFPAAVAGWLFGYHEEYRFQPEYTAEAWVYVRSWAEQLDKAAGRAQIPLAMPVEAPLFRMSRDVQGYRLMVKSTDRLQAVGDLEAQIAQARTAVDSFDKALQPFVDHLRSQGIAEVNLQRPQRVEVMVAPHIVGQTAPQPWSWWYAALSAISALFLGSLWWLFQNEGLDVSHGTVLK